SLVRACADAVTDPATAEHFDAAATGAAADDKPEAEALSALLSAQQRPFPVAVGAVRGQVGQVGAAGAAAGLVKACLALHHQVLPPTAGGEVGPRFWLTDEGEPRRAVVAAAGVDGSVSHVVLEAYQSAAVEPDPHPLGDRPEAVFAVEGDSPADLLAGLAELRAFTRPLS